MSQKNSKKNSAPKKKVVAVKKEEVAKEPAEKTTELKKVAEEKNGKVEKTVPSFDSFLPPAPEPEKTVALIENVDFDTFVNSKDSAPSTKKSHTPKKATKSLDFKPELKDEDLEKLKAKAVAFTGKVYGRTWVRKNMLEEFAREEFGSGIESKIGLNPSEIVFEIHGVRIPEEGVFVIR